MEERGFRIHGRVQGVGFRWWTRKTAEALGVEGTVRTVPDGTVEVMVRGEAPKVDRFANKLREGPSPARVEKVEEMEAEVPEGLSGFRIER
ncbi:MAG TPA: acylphosphatase [Longimicrobiales bacterium]|nr:acylphosphatase [Longimicrobiales bacterium]